MGLNADAETIEFVLRVLDFEALLLRMETLLEVVVHELVNADAVEEYAVVLTNDVDGVLLSDLVEYVAFALNVVVNALIVAAVEPVAVD